MTTDKAATELREEFDGEVAALEGAALVLGMADAQGQDKTDSIRDVDEMRDCLWEWMNKYFYHKSEAIPKERVREVLDEMVVKKAPTCEQNALILSMRGKLGLLQD